MPSYYLDKGKWKEKITSIWSKDNSKWNDLVNRYHKVSGEWYPIYKYEWKIGAWSNCSKACESGTQTRTVDCYRSGKKIDNKSLCSKALKETPASTQVCNTQNCLTSITIYTSSDDDAWFIAQVKDDQSTVVHTPSSVIHLGEFTRNYTITLPYRLDYVYGGYIYYKTHIVNLYGGPIGSRVQVPNKGCGTITSNNPPKGRVSSAWINTSCWHGVYPNYSNIDVIYKIPVSTVAATF